MSDAFIVKSVDASNFLHELINNMGVDFDEAVEVILESAGPNALGDHCRWFIDGWREGAQ